MYLWKFFDQKIDHSRQQNSLPTKKVQPRSGLPKQIHLKQGNSSDGKARRRNQPRGRWAQAVKNILPTLGNEFISLIKETSIVSFVGAVDLCTAFRNIGNANYEYMVPYLAMALVYIVLVLLITFLVKCLEKRLRASDKR